MSPWIAFLIGCWVGGTLGVLLVSILVGGEEEVEWDRRLQEDPRDR